jgi:predicted metal-dependent phosphoesterase TrpH
MHTPGPWAFTEGDADRRAMSEIHKAEDKTFQIGYVTTEWRNPKQRAEDLANARLIAAAPDLLAVLERYVAADSGDETEDQLHRDAVAAITKARGQ